VCFQRGFPENQTCVTKTTRWLTSVTARTVSVGRPGGGLITPPSAPMRATGGATAQPRQQQRTASLPLGRSACGGRQQATAPLTGGAGRGGRRHAARTTAGRQRRAGAAAAPCRPIPPPGPSPSPPPRGPCETPTSRGSPKFHGRPRDAAEAPVGIGSPGPSRGSGALGGTAHARRRAAGAVVGQGPGRGNKYNVRPLASCQPVVRATGTRMRGEDPRSMSADTEGEVCVVGRGTEVARPGGAGAGEGVCRSALRRAAGRKASAGRGKSRGGVSESSGARGPTESCGHRLEMI